MMVDLGVISEVDVRLVIHQPLMLKLVLVASEQPTLQRCQEKHVVFLVGFWHQNYLNCGVGVDGRIQ